MSAYQLRRAMVGHLASFARVRDALGVPDAAAAARRLWPDVAPAGAALPLVVHQITGMERPKHLRPALTTGGAASPDGEEADWPVRAELSIVCAGRTPEEAARVADAVRICLSVEVGLYAAQPATDTRVVWVDATTITDARTEIDGAEGGFPVQATDGSGGPALHMATLEASIWYRLVDP